MKRLLAFVLATLLTAAPAAAVGGLSSFLTPQQQAFLGCGAFYGVSCSNAGLDLLRTEVSVILQEWPPGDSFQTGPTGDPLGPIGTRFYDGILVQLPGSRGGTPGSSGLLHPLTGQVFASEMAALSWNALMTFAALSVSTDGGPGTDGFDPSLPFRSDGCSFARPHECSAVAQFLAPGAAVPEPGAALLFGLGAAAVVSATRRRR